MGVSYLAASAVCTVLSLAGLQWWTNSELAKFQSDGSLGDNGLHSGNTTRALELLLGSYVTIGLLANFSINLFILVILCIKTIFFVKLYPSETRKVVERLVNYVVYKGTLLPLVVPPIIFQAALWSTWLTVLCSLKMFQGLARERLERLNASPSATSWAYFRVFSVLLLVLSVDLLWIRLCLLIYTSLGSSMFLLLFFEPLCIGFETLQAIMVHGFQLLDMCHRQSMDSDADCHHPFDRSAAGTLYEWKGILIRNLGFLLDLMTLLTGLGHYLHIWWLHGMAFHLVDVVLFLNIRALVSTIIERVKGFIKLKQALSSLNRVLPDATADELYAYNDDCSICREPMARAKRLACNHLFHLACLRSWLDQGLSEVHACPTCRRPLFAVPTGNYANSRAAEVLHDEQLARQLSSGLDHSAQPGHLSPPMVAFPNQQQNTADSNMWRGMGLNPGWMQPWPGQGFDGTGPSTTAISSVGFGSVQMMMRHLASVGDSYGHSAIEDSSWSLWPMAHPSAASGSSPPPVRPPVRYDGNTNGLRFRNTNDNISSLLAMADTVREVLPHIPDELILQDLQRTHNVAVTVNNLLQI
ncbi:E3 ubiquitin protein ligase RIN2-like [Aristolochia californica]|uniref:E3 ubiquitin protein ligase RIN2-like n=1 Tax=Aristolochia californica TaxID=171875 RepID=UPI0035DBFD1D